MPVSLGKSSLLLGILLVCMLQPSFQQGVEIATLNTCGVAVCFAIDRSGSISNSDFGLLKAFVVQVIQQVTALTPISQYGASQFDSTSRVVPGLGDMTSNAAAAVSAINALGSPGGATNMEGGVSECFKLNTTTGAKSGIITRNINPALSRILMLLTDGVPNRINTGSSAPVTGCSCTNGPCSISEDCGRRVTAGRALNATNDGIKFISIGVGSGVNATFLQSLGRYVPVTDFNALASIVQDILREVCSDVGIAKEPPSRTVTVGNRADFNITIRNEGSFNVGPPIIFTDTLPVGLTYNMTPGVTRVSGPNLPVLCTQSGQVVNCTISGTLGTAATNSTVVYSLPATATAPGVNLQNVVVVSVARDNDNNNNRATANVTVLPPPLLPDQLSITKTANPTSVILGSQVRYTITVNNTAPFTDAINANITDTVPAGLQVVSGSLTSGCSVTGQIVTCSPINITAASTRTYSYNVTALQNGTLNNQAVLRVGTITKGPVTATVVVTSTCANFAWNGSAVVSFPCGTGFTPKPNSGSTSPANQTACCNALPTNATITKTVNPSSVLISQNVTYTIRVNNTGQTVLTNVIVRDNLPSGLVFAEIPSGCSFPDGCLLASNSCTRLQCLLSSVAIGASQTITVKAKATDIGTLTNNANATFDVVGGGPGSTPPATAPVLVNRTCGVFNATGGRFPCPAGTDFVQANASNQNPSQAVCCRLLNTDVTVRKTVSPSSVLISQNVTYTITVNNTGETEVTGVVVRDNLPAGLVFAEIPSGCIFPDGCVLTSNTCTRLQCGPYPPLLPGATRTIVVKAKAIMTGTYNNNATATFNVTGGGNQTTPPTEVPVTINRTCGVFNATGGRFPCPAGTDFVQANASNQNPSQAVCCRLLNTDVIVRKTVSPSSVLISQNVTYTITVNNTGETEVTDVVVRDNLPAGLVFAEIPSGCIFPDGCVLTSNTCTRLQCGPYPPLLPGATRTIVVKAKAIMTGTYNNNATATFNVTGGGNQTTPPTEVPVTINRTCDVFNASGAPFPCRPGTELVPSNASNQNPSQAVCCTDTPIFTASKAAYTNDSILCGSTAASCNIPSGQDFFWVVEAAVTQGIFASFQINDTVPASVATGQQAFFKVNGVVTPPNCSPTGTTTYSCSISGPFGARPTIQLWIPVRAPVAQQAQTISNTAQVTGVPPTGTPTTEEPTATITVLRQIVCDASIVKLPGNPSPVFVGGSSQPPTTNFITQVAVAGGTICDQVVLTSTLDSGLEISATPVASGGGVCSLNGNSGYTCVWPRTAGPQDWLVAAIVTVALRPEQAPATLTDTGVLSTDNNTSNNQATASVQVLSGAIPDLFVSKTGPSVVVPVNTRTEFIVLTGVNNDFRVQNLTLVERLSGLNGAYFVDWPAECAPTDANDTTPIEVTCFWLAPSPSLSLTFGVTSTEEGTVLNTATLSTPGAPSRNDTDTASFCDQSCPPPPVVAVDKTVDIGGAQFVAPDQQFTYTVVPTLVSGVAATVTVFDSADPAIRFVSVTSPTTGCSLSSTAVVCQVAPGTPIVIRARATETGTWTNTAKVVAGNSSATDSVDVNVFRSTCGDVTFGPPEDPFTGCPQDQPYDPNNADNFPPSISTCCDTNAQAAPEINILKTSSSNSVQSGQTVDWTITVTNPAPVIGPPITAENVQVVDTFPSQVTIDTSSVTISGGTNADRCSFSGQRMTCSLNTMSVGSVKVIQVTVTAKSVTRRTTVTNTATVTCNTRGAPNPACTDTATDDITIIRPPPTVVPVSVDKSANPRRGPRNSKFTFTIVVQPVQSGTTASTVVLTDVIDRSLRGVRLLTTLGGKCSFNQGTYTLTCNWAQLRVKQTVRFEARGSKPGSTVNTATVTFRGGRASSSADIFVQVLPKGSCCDGSYMCYDGITKAQCDAKGAGSVWTSWATLPPVTCASSSFCKGACCSEGLTTSCKCPWCRQTAKNECPAGDTWIPGASCNTPSICPSQCKNKCQPCSGAGDTSCCPGLACVCSGSKWGARYICAPVNPYGGWGSWGSKFGKRSTDLPVTDLLAPIGGTCGRVPGGLQCAGPNVDCVLDGTSEAGTCRPQSTLLAENAPCTGHGQCAGGLRCDAGTCKRATCPAESGCAGDIICQMNYTFGCQVFQANTMSSFDG